MHTATQRREPPLNPKHRCGHGFVLATLIGTMCWAATAAVAEFERPVKIGVLTTSWGAPPSAVGLRDGLVERGYQEDVDFTIGVRFTQGSTEALSEAARGLVRGGSDIIMAIGDAAAKAAQQATGEIAIVFVAGTDPVGAGLVESFARPGGNLTGVTQMDKELGGKRLEIFRELIPGLQRVMYPHDANNAYSRSKVEIYREAAEKLGMVLVAQPLRTLEEARAVLGGIRHGEIDGFIAPFGTELNIFGLLVETSSRESIPAIHTSAISVEMGGFASYAPSAIESGRLAARIVDKIIKGADPGEIPVEVNNTIELVINLKVAKELGITVPPEVLYQADRIIR